MWRRWLRLLRWLEQGGRGLGTRRAYSLARRYPVLLQRAQTTEVGMKRTEHTFQFPAREIALAAKEEAEYHEEREALAC